MPSIPSHCPSCGGELRVVRLECEACESVVEGAYAPSPVSRLGAEEREMFDRFMFARGNLKDVQRELGLSYPTVRRRIERMFEQYEIASGHRYEPMDVLKRLAEGEIDVDEAEELLRRSGGDTDSGG